MICTFVNKIRNFYNFSNPSKISNSMGRATSNAAVFHVQTDDFDKMPRFHGGFSVYGPKKAPCNFLKCNVYDNIHITYLDIYVYKAHNVYSKIIYILTRITSCAKQIWNHFFKFWFLGLNSIVT